MKTPDITPAQIVAVAGSAIATLAAFGLPISQEQTDAILDLVKVVSPILLLSDAGIRFGRALMVSRKLSDQDIGIAPED